MSALIVHRDSRTERLATQLAEALEAACPESPLASQLVVVAHPGLRRWLLGEFARRGRRGIAANFDMILPWQWLERSARKLLGDDALIGGSYRSESLRWHVYAALPMLDAAAVQAYLRGDGAERRRFQLADHLAAIYTQYLIYRPDWITGWEHGAEPDNWQARLWRSLRKSIAAPHRAQRRESLLTALAASGDGEQLPLHVFGVSHLAPDILDAFHALSRHRPVHLYFPDPCRQYWADFRTQRELLKLQPDAVDLHYEIGHPLLVSLGRMAQDFFIQLDARGVELSAGEGDDTAGTTLLQGVQASIRDCEPALAGAPVARVEDTSLRVHACHTRLRELEVLKDALLGLLADDETLQHRDIVVMAPNIVAYVPYLRAVFGEPARYDDHRAHIPWHLADVGLAQMHPLLGAFSRVLDLGDSRFTVSEIMDFLDIPAIAQRFGIDADAREVLEQRIRSARIAWGLDAAMKAHAGAAPIDQNSWSFGFDRLFAGLIAGDDTDDELLDGVFPVRGMSGGEGEVIGRLERLFDALRRAYEGFAVPRSLLAWRDWLLDQVDALFAANSRDADATAALETLRRTIAKLGAQAEAAGSDALPWSVMREAVRSEFGRVSEQQPFLLGGVTFCGLVPQRSIPFRVVCLLGMNEGEFPRASGDAGLNLMLEKPRRGDRDTRREDRYLFLEALMAARECLHISYIGEGVQDGKQRNPASPLAELLQFLDAQYGLAGEAHRPWLIEHPLQPFDARYYTREDSRLFSFDPTFAIPALRRDTTPFFDFTSEPDAFEPDRREISLDWLKRFWRDPARAQLRDDAGVSLDSLAEETWPDREPLSAKTEAHEGVERRLLFDALARGLHTVSVSAPDWLARSGLLAAGAVGEQAYASARERAQAALEEARKFLGDTPRSCVAKIELRLDDLRLSGSVKAFRDARGRICLFGAKPAGAARFNELLPFYFDLAALRLTQPEGIAARYIEYAKDNKVVMRDCKLLATIISQDDGQLRAGLHRLAKAAVGASTRGLLFPPRTAWEWSNARLDKREGVARTQWYGSGTDHHPGERDYAPSYTALLTRECDFIDPQSPAHARFVETCELVAGVLDPRREVLLRATNGKVAT